MSKNTEPLIEKELLNSLSDFNTLSTILSENSEEFWLEKGSAFALDLFKFSFEKVPAYRRFLEEKNIKVEDIKTLKDFSKLPSTTKENYYDKYKLKELSIDGDLSHNYLICTSSGSSGKPHYWPRYKKQDILEPALIETAYSFLGIQDKSTLIISCLAMGTWVAGNMMIDGSLEIARQEKYNLTVITPGANNKQILEIVQDIGHFYDQIIFIGYPPTVRNIIVEGSEIGIEWKNYSPKFVVGGEPISEHWKRFVLDKISSDNLMDVMVIFGMAEMHLVSFVTPIAAYIARELDKNPSITKRIFGTRSLTVLQQYNPAWRWLEQEGKELVISALCGIPLPKYRSHDLGGVITLKDLTEKLQGEGIDIISILEKEGYAKETIWQLPFFYSLGRGDAVSLMGANIYPGNIEKFFHKHHTINDFKIGIEHNELEQSQFSIHFELRDGKSMSGEEERVFSLIAQEDTLGLLMENNEDFADAYTEEPLAMTPRIYIHPFKKGPFGKKYMKQSHILT